MMFIRVLPFPSTEAEGLESMTPSIISRFTLFCLAVLVRCGRAVMTGWRKSDRDGAKREEMFRRLKV